GPPLARVPSAEHDWLLRTSSHFQVYPVTHRSLTATRRHVHSSAISRSGFGRLLVSHIRQSEQSRTQKSTKIGFALLLCAVLAFLLPTTASTRTAPPAEPRVVVPMSLDHMAREIVYLVNLERAQHSLPPL